MPITNYFCIAEELVWCSTMLKGSRENPATISIAVVSEYYRMLNTVILL